MFDSLSFSQFITLHVEYLSLLHPRIKILSPDLVRGRQSMPIFPSFPLRDLVFAARRPSDEQSSYRAIVRPSGPSLSEMAETGG